MKTAELIGDALDRAVAKCMGVTAMEWSDNHGGYETYSPSTDWAFGGPIIEQMGISVWEACNEADPQEWMAITSRSTWGEDGERDASYGPTPLVAAMRCYVASRLGDEIEVPSELHPA
jgi:hypothetical protein